jgi:hypothetical protein
MLKLVGSCGGISRCLVAEPADIECELGPAHERQPPGCCVLEELVSEPAGQANDDHPSAARD